jgi:hypothetical protein
MIDVIDEWKMNFGDIWDSGGREWYAWEGIVLCILEISGDFVHSTCVTLTLPLFHKEYNIIA